MFWRERVIRISAVTVLSPVCQRYLALDKQDPPMRFSID